MDPKGPESTWVTLARIIGWILLEWGGIAFLLSLTIWLSVNGTEPIQGNSSIYFVAATGSLAGIGLLLILFVGRKRSA